MSQVVRVVDLLAVESLEWAVSNLSKILSGSTR